MTQKKPQKSKDKEVSHSGIDGHSTVPISLVDNDNHC
ncbi:hypothetical protein Bhyg_09951 [Pseudolycoriella hygida]|uniref:Uncharacterized protein n=1 Tax=Pseudolycoriella hygida TaxID=35572 RepID=A0A9Q0MSI7_9DIPT|nr:hypothetical protein Bhyg_09951 [Pseudolycoriella hygida]